MSVLLELKTSIAASIFMSPCTEEVLMSRNFLQGLSCEEIKSLIMSLETEGVLFYRGNTMRVKKKWAASNLSDYELDID